MPNTDYLYFGAYFEPRESTSEWYREMLYQLWRYGLSFAPSWKKIVTWEEELENQPEFARTTGGASQAQRAPQPLARWIEEAATTGFLALDAYDKGFELLLTLQPRPRRSSEEPDALKTLGMLEITYNKAYMNPEHDVSHSILPFYLQTWMAHIHWAEVCCMLLNPLYEVSYQEVDIVPDEVVYRGRDTSDRLDDPLLKVQRKVHAKLPVQIPRLEGTRLQYFSPQLLTEEEERSLQRLPYVFSEYLPTGGLMVIPRAEPLHYGFGMAYSFLHRAREAYEHSEQMGDEAEQEGDRLGERGTPLFDVYREMLRH